MSRFNEFVCRFAANGLSITYYDDKITVDEFRTYLRERNYIHCISIYNHAYVKGEYMELFGDEEYNIIIDKLKISYFDSINYLIRRFAKINTIYTPKLNIPVKYLIDFVYYNRDSPTKIYINGEYDLEKLTPEIKYVTLSDISIIDQVLEYPIRGITIYPEENCISDEVIDLLINSSVTSISLKKPGDFISISEENFNKLINKDGIVSLHIDGGKTTCDNEPDFKENYTILNCNYKSLGYFYEQYNDFDHDDHSLDIDIFERNSKLLINKRYNRTKPAKNDNMNN